MTPTSRLRFVEREILVPYQNYKDVVQPKTVRILQQWWEDREKTTGVSQTGDGPMVKHHPGEWRDVPIEKEQA
jgi:hypothetical protein